MHYVRTVALAVSILIVSNIFGAEPRTGPLVESYGPVFEVPEGSFNLAPDQQYKIVMDVGEGPEDAAAINRGIESAARLLNMSVRNGIKPENLRMAIVLHGTAARAALSNEAHSRHSTGANPNSGLLAELGKAGVDVYLCGQSAAYRGYSPADLLPGVDIAVSAMTAHVRLQQDGYRAVLF